MKINEIDLHCLFGLHNCSFFFFDFMSIGAQKMRDKNSIIKNYHYASINVINTYHVLISRILIIVRTVFTDYYSKLTIVKKKAISQFNHHQ